MDFLWGPQLDLGFTGSRSLVTKEFKLDIVSTQAVPREAMMACLSGNHKPINPHRQRLLVAAHKATKVLAKEAGSTRPKGTGKRKTVTKKRKKNTKLKGASALKAQKKDAKPQEASEVKAKKTDTLYNVQRKKFLATLLDWHTSASR